MIRSHDGPMAASMPGLREVAGQPSAWLTPLVVEKRLTTVFQPIFDVRTGAAYGFEALTRDRTAPERGFPTELATRMRDAGRAVEFNLACVRAALENARRIGLPGRLFVNVDPVALEPGTVEAIDVMLGADAAATDWHRLVIEVTESTHTDPSTLAGALTQLRDRGAAIALDDFGEGFSSLRLWSQVRPQIVKIDRHFCQGIDGDRYKQEFVRSLRRLSARLGIVVIAEGVETPAELDALAALDVRLVQGYLLGLPRAQPERTLDRSLLRSPGRSAEPSDRLGHLARAVVPTSPEVTTDAVFERFEREAGLQLLPIVLDGVPLGLLERSALTGFLARPFRRELFGRRSVMHALDRAPLMLEEDALVSDAARLLADKDDGTLDAGVVVTSGGRYVGIVLGRDLVRAIADQQIQAARQANPLTQLPANQPIDRETEARLARREGIVAAYIDIDHFKPFNDTHGYGTGDEVLRGLARTLQRHLDPEVDFVGHVGGDDFVILFGSPDWRARIDRVRDDFARDTQSHFGPEERRLSSFPGRDRDGTPRRFRLLDLSVGVVIVPPGHTLAKERLLRLEAGAKQAAKRRPGDAVHVIVAADEPDRDLDVAEADRGHGNAPAPVAIPAR